MTEAHAKPGRFDHLRGALRDFPPLAWSFLYFFFLLTGYYVLRPVRDAMGAANDPSAVFPVAMVDWFAARGIAIACGCRAARRWMHASSARWSGWVRLRGSWRRASSARSLKRARASRLRNQPVEPSPVDTIKPLDEWVSFAYLRFEVHKVFSKYTLIFLKRRCQIHRNCLALDEHGPHHRWCCTHAGA